MNVAKNYWVIGFISGMLVGIAVLTWQSRAWAVFDWSNFVQNTLTAKSNILQEIRQIQQLENQLRAWEAKGAEEFVMSDSDFTDHLKFYQQIQKDDEEMYGNLEDAEKLNAEYVADHRASGLSPEDWQAQEQRFYDRRHKTQVVRATRAKTIRTNIRTGIAKRQDLIAQNREAASTVEGIQTTNELLAQVANSLDVVNADIADKNVKESVKAKTEAEARAQARADFEAAREESLRKMNERHERGKESRKKWRNTDLRTPRP